eukprot:TRINITY_DN5542_c0_g1_i1.p1 TRINITY_DN5542_c0_g1~~TRINITY_DN5542_c0_g1_i1.p1  ORF type:complete len:150 (-),score=10.20 TRINITY_DN5542_c0_g1_i1:389-838(-)
MCIRDRSIYRFGIGNEKAKEISEALKVNKTLRFLDLGFNDIKDEDMKAIYEAVKANTTLAIYYNHNKYTENPTPYVELLKINKTITNTPLSLAEMKLQDVKAFSDALRVNKSLTDLTIFNYSLKEEKKLSAQLLRIARLSQTCNLTSAK